MSLKIKGKILRQGFFLLNRRCTKDRGIIISKSRKKKCESLRVRKSSIVRRSSKVRKSSRGKKKKI